MVEYARVAQGRYLTYAAKGLDVMKDTDLEHEFAKAVAANAVIGTPDEVVAQLTDYVTALPVDLPFLRPQWPTMTADDETIATLGLPRPRRRPGDHRDHAAARHRPGPARPQRRGEPQHDLPHHSSTPRPRPGLP